MTKKLIPTERMRDQLMMQSKAKGALEKFLKDSKVKQRVYHGTTKDFGSFSHKHQYSGEGGSHSGSGFYFTNNPESASRYAIMKGESGSNVMPVYLNIKKPLHFDWEQGETTGANLKLTPAQVRTIMLAHPKIKDEDESPLTNWGDIRGGAFHKTLNDAVKSYAGSSMLAALRNDFFGDDHERWLRALHKATGYDSGTTVTSNGDRHYIAWFPEQIKSAIGNRGTYDPNDPDITKAKGGNVDRMRDHMMVRGFAIGGWHGSPHDIPMGRSMKMEKIGTGEGAQAYGHGLYAAETRDVAENYAPRVAKYEDDLMRRYEKASRDQDYTKASVYEAALLHESPVQMKSRYTVDNGYTPEQVKKYHQVIDKEIDPLFKKNKMGIYKLELSHPDPAKEAATPLSPKDFLHWDLPLSQQPESVRKSLYKLDKKVYGNALWQMENNVKRGNALSGGQFYDLLAANERDAANATGPRFQSLASEKLRQIGIPGIRYLDAGSRGKGKGTHNYVIFDPSLINIVGKEAKGGSIHPSIDTMKLALLNRK